MRNSIQAQAARALVAVALAAILLACGGGGSSGGEGSSSGGGSVNLWTWMGGSNSVNQPGDYGLVGVPAASNAPGSRYSGVTWTDGSGNLWVFGGSGYPETAGAGGSLNDLWRFDGTLWTWMGGRKTLMQPGVYGTLGQANAANIPGARAKATGWRDSSGNLWLFGGHGVDGVSGQGILNDLWRYDGAAWTWMGGSNLINAPGVYGTKGVPAASNVPGARHGSSGWTDSSGNFWLFGGLGNVTAGSIGYLNDLWRFDGTQWTWIAGGNALNASGVYGTKGVAAAANTPGGRAEAAGAGGAGGILWLWGGTGYDSAATANYLNDLWRFDGTQWTWISGSNLANEANSMGTQGVAAASNVPGSRTGSIAWLDPGGQFWLFGGHRLDMAIEMARNDLWRFDGIYWTWISGQDIVADFGTLGVPAATNRPGARPYAMKWRDGQSNLWFFGGGEFFVPGNVRNDIWRYQP